MNIKNLLFAAVICVGIVATSCQRFPSVHVKNHPIIVVSIPPYVSLVQAIAGYDAIVKSAIQPDFDPHTMEATPNQRKLVQQADLFIAVGALFEHKLLSILREDKRELRILHLDEIPSELLPGGSPNIHFWLSLKCLSIQVEMIAKMLSQMDPSQKPLYDYRANLYLRKIETLDKHIQHILAPFRGKALLVPHAALCYFCAEYHLAQIAVESEGKDPGPKDVLCLLDVAKHANVACAFTFPQFGNKGVELIANELGLSPVAFNPLGDSPLESIEKLAQSIADHG